MALPATGVLEVRGGTGSDTNSGGFVSGGTGTDWSQQAAAQYSVTDAVTAGTTSITSATANFGTDVVDNYLYIQGGSGSITAGWYRIVSRTDATTVVVDRSTGLTAGAGATLKIGGALNTLTKADAIGVAGNDIHVKSATYGETFSITVSGGNGTPRRWLGYETTRGDNPLGTGRPLIDGASTRSSCISANSTSGNILYNFRAASSTSNVVTGGAGGGIVAYDCKFSSGGGNAIAPNSGAFYLYNCELSNNTGGGVLTGSPPNVIMHACYVHDNATTGTGATSTARWSISDCIFEANAGHNISYGSSGYMDLINCTIHGSTGANTDGVNIATDSATWVVARNCIISGNARYGVNRTASTKPAFLDDHNAYYGNATAATNNVTLGLGSISGTDPQFTDSANGNYAIGTNLKALGTPGAFPGATSTGYIDIGAVQREEAGAGGGLIRHPGMAGGCNA